MHIDNKRKPGMSLRLLDSSPTNNSNHDLNLLNKTNIKGPTS